MAVQDLWRKRDGTPSARDGRGLRYRVTVKGYPVSSHRTKAEADWVNAQRIAAGPPKPSDTATVGDLVARWLDGKRGLSAKGYEACSIAASYVHERWRTTAVENVQAHEVQSWLALLRTPAGPASASLKHKVLQCIRGALGDRVDLRSVRVPSEQRREAVFLTAKQLRKLAAARPEAEAMILFLGTTGLRIGECCALDVGDVDMKRRRVRVHKSKTGKGRDVPVPKSVLEMLDLEREATAPLFTTRTGGRIDKDHWRARHWVPARDALGVEGLRVHDLRHTAASLAIASGADVKAVQRMLGHSSAAMTLDVYAGLFDKGLDDVAKRMDKALRR